MRYLCFKTRVCLMWITYLFFTVFVRSFFKVTSKRFREEKGLTVRYDSHEMAIKTLVFLTLSNKDLLFPFFLDCIFLNVVTPPPLLQMTAYLLPMHHISSRNHYLSVCRSNKTSSYMIVIIDICVR